MKHRIPYGYLPTEQNNPFSKRIDQVSILKSLQIINREDQKVAKSVSNVLRPMAKAVALIVKSLKNGGRLIFVGAGTSGRLGVLEAAECPPTFNTPPAMVQAIMAGGNQSVFKSKEGAEDQINEGARQIRLKARKKDVVVGIASSGVTPFVQGALRESRRVKAQTILVTCFPKISKSSAHIIIAPLTGAEIIAGSTRLKAGTATKLVLNSLTVASMIQLGKVYGNWMVDLQPRSQKLKARALRLIQLLGKVSGRKAGHLLKKSKGHAKTAILMARQNISRKQALKKLSKSKGHLHRALNS